MTSLELQEHVLLAPLTTIGVGGPARFFADIRSEQHLVQALAFARARKLPVAVVGGGSNLLVHDEGFPGLVLRLALEPRLAEGRAGGATLLTASAGLSWDDLVLASVERQLGGMECLAGIPGLTGASPVQNIGAYGQEVAQTLHHLRAYDRHLSRFVQITGAECGFAYRTSRFNTLDRDRFLITSVTFRLEGHPECELRYADLQRYFGAGARPSPLAVYRAVREIRARKGMLIPNVAGETARDPDTRSAGSFFKNPLVPADRLQAVATAAGVSTQAVPHWTADTSSSSVKLAAAWLVETAGFPKGFALGNAGISSKHSLALINRTGRAHFAEIATLRDRVRSTVAERFGVLLEQEPIEVGPGTGTSERARSLPPLHAHL